MMIKNKDYLLEVSRSQSIYHIVQVLPRKSAYLDAYLSYDPAILPSDSIMNCE